MKTTKLYENNTYLRSCTAVVTDVRYEQMSTENSEQMCIAAFDQTVFFPEGGGQSCDIGTAVFTESGEHSSYVNAIQSEHAYSGNDSHTEQYAGEHVYYGNCPREELDAKGSYAKDAHTFSVIDVQEKCGVVYHTLKGNAPLPAPGDVMVLTIDWEHRFDNMQRHLGEHILSGAFYRLFGAVNKGFHMGDDYITIDLDFDREVQDRLGLPHLDRVTWKMAEEAELAANRVIWADAPVVRSHFDTREEAEKMPLRKRLAFDDDISIVTVGELPAPYDCVACCGTHPSSAGQVGLIKIYKIEPNKGMSRVYLECGERAFRHYETRLDDMYDIACSMSCGIEDLKEKYGIAQEKSRALRDRLSGMVKRVVAAEAESIIEEAFQADHREAPESTQDSPLMAEKNAADPVGVPGIVTRYYDDLSTDDLLSIVKQLEKSVRSAGTSIDGRYRSQSASEISSDNGARPSAALKLAVLVSLPENTVILASPCGAIDCGKLVKENAPSFSGKGGGKPGMARAMFSTAEDLNGFIEAVRSAVK